jgi:predicted Ser/Thr protein kinase
MCPRFNSTIVAKFAHFESETPYLDAETAAYQRIENDHIVPRFFGHLGEKGRLIGFTMERIADCRHASSEDLPPCQRTLSKLHEMGIKHGDINKHNLLIPDGKVTLIDFDNSTRGNDEETLEEEFQRLQEELGNTSGRGGRTVETDEG